MRESAQKMAGQYCATLRQYLARHDEALLQEAYELGRRAIGRGLGVQDMACLHQQALAECLSDTPSPPHREGTLKSAETFIMESLSPFEAAHRGFREANRRLRQLNDTLAHRNEQLADANRKLALEMRQRRRTEQALRHGEEHYRHLFHGACLMQEKLRRLSSQVLHAQEEERKRISRELHDEVGQALTAIQVSLALLSRNGAVDMGLLGKQVGETQQLVGKTMEKVRRFARELRPDLLDQLGLVPALRSCLYSFSQRTGLRVRFQASPGTECLSEEQKSVVFRVAQESLTNVAKHARASQVTVSLRKLKNAVRLRVKDNGRAFAVGPHLSSNHGDGLGLLGMQERARLVNGRFAVTSARGRGTCVSVEIPFPMAAAPAAAKPAPVTYECS